METFPKTGMTYKQVRDRLIKDKDKYQANKNLRLSIMRQCERHEGSKAVEELANEVFCNWKGGSKDKSLTGAGNKQSGWGDKVKCDPMDGFVEVSDGVFTKEYK